MGPRVAERRRRASGTGLERGSGRQGTSRGTPVAVVVEVPSAAAQEACSPPNPGVRFDPARAIWWLGCVGSGVIMSRRQLTDYDLPWNLATGRLLLERGRIPSVDELAYTARPLRYVEVFGDASLFALYSRTGAAGLQVLCAGIGLLAVALLHVRTARLGALRWLWGALGLFALSDWCVMRPVMFSWLAILLTLGALDAHRRDPEQRRGRAALASLVPLFFLWANVHGFVALGVPLVLAYAAYRALVARIVAWFGHAGPLGPALDGRGWRYTGIVAALATAAACINSMGPRLLLGPFRLNERFDQITEWARPSLQYFVSDQPFLSLWFLLSLALWATGRDRLTGNRIPSAFSAGEVLFAAAVTAGAVRMFPLGALLMAHAATSRMNEPMALRPLVAAACAGCPLIAALGLAIEVPLSKPAGFDRAYLPVGAAEFIAAVHPRGRMYNFMPYGGYLALHLWPEHRVFTDGRDVLAREQELIDAVSRAARNPADFATLERRFGFDWAVVSAREGELLDAGIARSTAWVMIYLDDISAVYVRRDGESAALGAGGYRVLRHLIQPGPLLLHAATLDPSFGSDLAHDGALALTQAPDSPRAAFLAACGALATRDEVAFEAAYRRLAWLMPTHPALALLSARWQEAQGRT